MVDFTTVTDEQLERARHDPAFRRQLLSKNLELLLARLNQVRHARTHDTVMAQQVREGLDLAVKLADMLQTTTPHEGPPKAA